MEGMPRVAFAAALTVALSLTLLLTVLLLLLANLFCSLLRRRRRRAEPAAAASPEEPGADRPLSFPFYAHGVLQAPTKFLLSVPILEEAAVAKAKANTAPAISPPPPRKAVEEFVYISNPIYDAGVSRECAGGDDGSTQFVTPKASPSGLEADDDEVAAELGGDNGWSPPLKVMKKLPPAAVLPRRTTSLGACLVADGRRSLATSTETNCRPTSSSSSSNSLCSSPSW